MEIGPNQDEDVLRNELNGMFGWKIKEIWNEFDLQPRAE